MRAARASRLALLVCAFTVSFAAVAEATPALKSGHGLKVGSVKRLSHRLFETSVRTKALPGPASVRILLPRDYRDHPNRDYPVLYLLHGTSGGANDWTEMGDAAMTTAGRNLIVVMPDIALNRDGGGWCTDWPNGPYAWERFHVDQLVPWVDQNLRTRRNRGGRAIIGLSQGGFCAISYSARHPDLFGTAYSFSGPPDIAHSPEAIAGVTAIITATEVVLDGVPAGSMFGDRATNEVNWKAHDGATLAPNLRHTRMRLYTGNGTPGPYDSGDPPNPGADGIEAAAHQDTRLFAERLDELGIGYHLRDYGPGTHTFPYWARDLRWSIGPLMRSFAHPKRLPRLLNYRSADDRYRVYGWRVRMRRKAREFSALRKATCHSFTVQGSGSASVGTPPCLRPRTTYAFTIRGEPGMQSRAGLVRSDRRGRVRLKVPLGPANPFQQYTPQAEAAGTKVFRSKVRLRRG